MEVKMMINLKTGKRILRIQKIERDADRSVCVVIDGLSLSGNLLSIKYLYSY